MTDIRFSDEQANMVYDFLLAIQNNDFLANAENDSSSAYWSIENRVDDIIEDLYKIWRKPLYKLEQRVFPNNSYWGVYRITNACCEFTNKDKAIARAKCNEMNASFVDT